MTTIRDLVGRFRNRNGRPEPIALPPAAPAPPAESLSTAADRINAELGRRATEPVTFSADARKRLELLHAEYLADLGQEAVRTARRNHVTTVDESHVKQASVRLGMGRASTSPVETTANTFGGVFAGAGIASVYAIMFTPGPHTTGETAVALVLSVIGFVLLAIGLTMTVVRRKD